MSDFTGGLNLRADAFQLAPNESNDMLDVELSIGGGFVQRRVVTPFGGTGLAGTVGNLFAFNNTSGTHQVIAQSGTALAFSTGGNWTALGTMASSGKTRAALFNNRMYFANNATASYSWDGTTYRTLTQTFNNTIGGEGANDGNMPFAKMVVVHESRLFIAGTVESSTAFPNRIRWSHTGFAEDWRAQDFIDIDTGHDGDVITAIVPFRGRLYIFKQAAQYELVGSGPENFQVINVDTSIGCVGQEAALVTDVGLFFFSYPQGVYLDRGTGAYPIFDKMFPLIRDGLIPQTETSSIAMGWMNKNLWLSVPYMGDTAIQTPTITSVTQHGTPGTTHATYGVVAVRGSGETIESNEVTTTTGNAVLDTSNYNVITWNAVAGADEYFIYKGTPGSTHALDAVNVLTPFYHDIGSTFVGVSPHTVNDTAGGSTTRTFVYNPWIYKLRYLRYLQGPWYPYGLPISAFLSANQPGGALLNLAANAQFAAVGQVEQAGQLDQWVSTQSSTAVPSFYTTRWYDVGSPSVSKRWRQPDVIMRAGTTASIRVDVRKNYDPSVLAKTYFVGQTADAGALVWDDGTGGVGGLWDDGTGTVGQNWAADPTNEELIVRGSAVGAGRSIQLTFTGPANAAWGIDALNLRFIVKRVRG